MKTSSGQVSVEFMLLIGFVLIIFIPLLLFMGLSGIGSAERFSEEAAMDMTVRIVDEARDTYYLGVFSKKEITVRIPSIVANLSVLNASSPSESQYYLETHFVSGGEERVVRRESEVPLKTDGTCVLVLDICVSGYDCERCFVEGIRSGTEQNIRLRTQSGPVNITVI